MDNKVKTDQFDKLESDPLAVPSKPQNETKPEIIVPEGYKKEETKQEIKPNTCPDCKGEGLKDQTTLCSRCEGTGKLKDDNNILIKPGATVQVNNDGTVKFTN